MKSNKIQLDNSAIAAQAILESQQLHVRELVADGSPRREPEQPAAQGLPERSKTSATVKERSITMPLWDFLIILIIFVAIGYVVGAAHQYAALI